MMTWIFDVLVPALNRARGLLAKCLPGLPWGLAAVTLLLSQEHMALRLVCLALCLFLHGRLVKLCCRKDGSWPGIVYLSAFFPLLMLHSSFLGLPLVWQVCTLVWAKHRR